MSASPLLESISPPSLDQQRQYWNAFDTAYRERIETVSLPSRRQGAIVLRWLDRMQRRDLRILDIGCAGGWLTEQLTAYGQVTATDLADEVIERASARRPDIQWLAGDVFDMPFSHGSFDVIIHLEVLAHIADQTRLMNAIANWLAPDGVQLLATQNPFVLSRMSTIAKPAPHQLRHWVSRRELRALLRPRFRVVEMFTIVPAGDQGILRWANATKLDRLASSIISARRVERVKEWSGLGYTIMCRAQPR